ncbi:MAG: hypothetical protein HUU15_16135 [Candidatus Brocadiae bacterium]|nr:hypothetical protein [Candidatus Brocadiia bacterium]
MRQYLGIIAAAAVAGCGVSQSKIDEQFAASKTQWEEYAGSVAEMKSEKVRADLTKRVVDIESNGATRNWVSEQVKQSQLATLNDADKKIAVLEKQLEEVKKKVDVVNMANKEEVMRVLTELQAITVTLVQQLKTQRDAMDASIRQLESIQVPEVPKDPK